MKHLVKFTLAFCILAAGSAWAQETNRIRPEEWPAYGRDKANTKYSPLDQIRAGNVKSLRIAWRWHSADGPILQSHPEIRTSHFECTPIMVDGVLYASISLSEVAAISPKTGNTLWLYEPGAYLGPTPPNEGFINRGVAYW